MEQESTVSFAPKDSDGTCPQGQLVAWHIEQIPHGIEVRYDVLGRARDVQGGLDRIQLEQTDLALMLRREPVNGVRLGSDATAADPISEGAGRGHAADEVARTQGLRHLPDTSARGNCAPTRHRDEPRKTTRRPS